MHFLLKTLINRKVWIAILIYGYVATLFAGVLIVPNKNGGNDVLNSQLVSVFSNQHISKSSFNNKDSHKLHLRINKHYQTEKFAFVVPQVIKISYFNTILPKPLYYYNNHFVSSFLYVCKGRAPPMIA